MPGTVDVIALLMGVGGGPWWQSTQICPSPGEPVNPSGAPDEELRAWCMPMVKMVIKNKGKRNFFVT